LIGDTTHEREIWRIVEHINIFFNESLYFVVIWKLNITTTKFILLSENSNFIMISVLQRMKFFFILFTLNGRAQYMCNIVYALWPEGTKIIDRNSQKKTIFMQANICQFETIKLQHHKLIKKIIFLTIYTLIKFESKSVWVFLFDFIKTTIWFYRRVNNWCRLIRLQCIHKNS